MNTIPVIAIHGGAGTIAAVAADAFFPDVAAVPAGDLRRGLRGEGNGGGCERQGERFWPHEMHIHDDSPWLGWVEYNV